MTVWRYISRELSISLFFLFFWSCGNAAIVRYIKPDYSDKVININEPDMMNKKFVIYETNGIKIFLKNISPVDLEMLSRLGSVENFAFRIPALTYLKFIVENNSDSNFEINFFSCAIGDPDGNLYSTLDKAKVEHEYTSVAYSNLRYEKLFSLYTTLYYGKASQHGYYYEQFGPGHSATIKPGFTGEQIVVFQRISERYPQYTLRVVLPDNSEQYSVPLKYIVYRSDMKP